MRDLLLHLNSYPAPTSPAAIAQAVRFAALMGAEISALAVEVDIRELHNPLANRLLKLDDMIREEEAASRRASHDALQTFAAEAAALGVASHGLHGVCDLYFVGEFVAARARARDLCLVAACAPGDGQRAVAETAVFASGRPVLFWRPGEADLLTADEALGVAVVAWDGSRAAARALADAVPVLKKARQVRVLSVVDEKPEAGAGIGAEAARHLKAHGIAAAVDEVPAAGRRIGPAMDAHLAACGANLLVMGAFGRSRLREFILGGATAHMLQDPKVALLLSH